MQYRNPIVPGYNPDPSICRAGDTFYLVNSTFEFFPGVPVHASKNLVNWELAGYVLDRESQLPLTGCNPSGGIFAPTIRYHDGMYYMITTNVNRMFGKGEPGNFIVHAENPAGPWSEPAWIDQMGIDPSIFFDDDGSCWYTGTGQGEHGQGIVCFKLDPMTGEPGLSVDISPDAAEYSLQEIFAYMEQSSSRCYVAFDEFQTVAEYADKRVEALLRSHIQQLTNVNFIFCGSKQHMLQNMFVTAARPFYQSTQMMTLGPIDAAAYYDFASQLLDNHGQKMEREVFEYLFDMLSAHTWYVHSILNRLYETGEPEITRELVEQVVRMVVEENAATYQTFLQLITSLQGRILRAVAQSHCVNEVLNANFLRQNRLGAASSVRTAVKSLVDKELLLQTDGGYQVYDRFFEQYLRLF